MAKTKRRSISRLPKKFCTLNKELVRCTKSKVAAKNVRNITQCKKNSRSNLCNTVHIIFGSYKLKRNAYMYLESITRGNLSIMKEICHIAKEYGRSRNGSDWSGVISKKVAVHAADLYNK